MVKKQYKKMASKSYKPILNLKSIINPKLRCNIQVLVTLLSKKKLLKFL